MKSDREIEFKASLLAEPATLTGPLFDDTTSANDWSIDENEIPSILEQLNSQKISLRLNHGDDIEQVVGRVNLARQVGNTVFIKTELADSDTVQKLQKGYLNGAGFSLRATAKQVLCSVCEQPVRPVRTCKCQNSHELLRGVRITECSIVTKPAYEVCRDNLRLA